MKKKIISMIIGLLVFSNLQAQVNIDVGSTLEVSDSSFLERVYNNLDTVKINTGLLLNKVILYEPYITSYTGELDTICSLKNWRTMYHQMINSQVHNYSWYNLKMLDSLAKNRSQSQNIVSIGFIDLRYNLMKHDALDRGLVNLDTINGFTDILGQVESPYTTYRVHAFSCLVNRVQGLSQNIELNSVFCISNNQDSIVSIEVNFDDGVGWVSIQKNIAYNVVYSTYGKKFIQFKTTYNNSLVLFSTTELDVVPQSNTPLARSAQNNTWSILADIPYNGTYGSGKAYIIYGCGNTTGHIRKPFVLVEGFDAKNNHDYAYLYDKLLTDPHTFYKPNDINQYSTKNDPNFLNLLRNNGYDVVMLDFTDGTTYMQENAYVLVKLIQMVNADKALIGSTQPLVVTGASMGGVVCRFALTYMEKFQAITGAHQTRLFISFDSPQSGANIALGLQYQAAYLYKYINLVRKNSEEKAGAIDTAYRTVNAPAAKQLLLSHYSETKSDGSVAPSPLRTIFLNELEDLGNYPQQCRKIAVINGNIEGTGQLFNPGALLASTLSISPFVITNTFLADNIFNGVALYSYAIKNNPIKDIVFGGAFFVSNFWIHKQKYEAKGFEIDNAPGGTIGLSHDFSPNTLNPYSCFIPSVSALDVKLTANTPVLTITIGAQLNYNIAANISSINSNSNGLTPFDAYYGAKSSTPNPTSPYVISNDSIEPFSNNQQHVSVNISNVDWAMQEIIAGENSTPMYVQNKQIVVNEDFVNKGGIFVGKNVTTAIPVGDVVVKNGVTCNMISSTEIVFRDGFVAESGSNFHAYINSNPIDVNTCNQLSRAANNTVINEVYYEDNTWQKQTTQNASLMRKENDTFINKSQNSINLSSLMLKIQIYPNPNNGEFLLELSNVPNGKYNLQITDAVGRSVMQQTINIQEQNLKQNINLQAQGKGIYFVKINSEQINEVRKVVVE